MECPLTNACVNTSTCASAMLSFCGSLYSNRRSGRVVSVTVAAGETGSTPPAMTVGGVELTNS
jgi:hypothetical protein